MLSLLSILLFNWNSILDDVEIELEKRGHILLPHDGKKTTVDKIEKALSDGEFPVEGDPRFLK